MEGMEGLKMVPYLALSICIAGVILGASTITLADFGENLDNKCFNSTYTYHVGNQSCSSVNTTMPTANAEIDRNFSEAFRVIWVSAEAEGTIAEQLGTIAIVGVMVVIISLIAGVFVYMRYFG